ncbi:MAG: sulfatase-like hydrolase/transferase [Planctomycetota bacterium]|nr:sulfatase-like hydrolase/transferase [Planctomycetota bacterium]
MLHRFALALLAFGPSGPSAAPPPNVLFVVIDDASWEEFTTLKLPTIQTASLAGRVYDRFYTSPVCSPTRAQVHFGRYPHDYLIGKALSHLHGTGVPTRDTSLAEALAVNGYATGLFGKWHLNGQKLPALLGEAPRLHGFETWRAGAVGNVTLAGGSHFNWERWDDGEPSLESTYSTHAIGDALAKWWSETSGPKFGVCSFLAPHEPFELAPPELLGGQTFPATDRGRFESALVAIDTKLLELATTLDLSNTFIFLFPDNGTPHQVPPPGALEKGYKTTPFEGGIRTPLVVWGPGVVPACDSGLVQAVDLPATVLALTGTPLPPGAMEDSISFAATLDGGASSQRPYVWSQRFSPNGGLHPSPLITHEWALVRADGMKLVQHETSGTPSFVIQELFDVVTDPHETTPLIDFALKQQLLALKAEALGPDWPY